MRCPIPLRHSGLEPESRNIYKPQCCLSSASWIPAFAGMTGIAGMTGWGQDTTFNSEQSPEFTRAHFVKPTTLLSLRGAANSNRHWEERSDVAISFRLSTRRRTIIATGTIAAATRLPRCARNNKVGVRTRVRSSPGPFDYPKFGRFCRRGKMSFLLGANAGVCWIPAFAGMTGKGTGTTGRGSGNDGRDW